MWLLYDIIITAHVHTCGSMLSCPALPAEVITTSSLNNSLHLKCIYPLHTRAYQLGGCSFSQFCQHACCRLTTSSLNNTLWTCAYVYIVHTSKPELFMGLLHIFCIISCTWEASKISTGVPLPYFFLLSTERNLPIKFMHNSASHLRETATSPLVITNNYVGHNFH